MSELRANTISDAAGTGPVTLTGQYAAKAWVNFNGTGTVAIREDGNVSSITDNGTGLYSVNLLNAVDDGNYAVTLGTNRAGTASDQSTGFVYGTQTTTSFNIGTTQGGTVLTDNAIVMASLFR